MYQIIHQIRRLTFNQRFALLLLIIMSTQFVAFEGFGTSPIKVGVMSFCFFFFFWKVPFVSKAVWCSIFYWTICFCIALLHETFRFSTLAYLGMFLMAYIVYYHLIYQDTFTLRQFKKILSYIIYAYCIILIFQQLSILIGVRNFPIINLVDHTGNAYYKWNRLPILTCEPSHSARIIIATMLGYIRCLEIEERTKISLKKLFSKENKWVSISFLWIIFMMGSGTAWFGFSILCLYFIHWRTFLYTIPIIVSLFFLAQMSNNEQLERVITIAEITITGDNEAVFKTDVSASTRISPLYNTFTIDLTKTESWIGKGNTEFKQDSWKDLTLKTPIVEQYGLIGFLFSLLLIYTCAIRKIISIETALFIFMSLMSLGNEYHIWSLIYIFTATRYFQTQKENGYLSNHSKL